MRRSTVLAAATAAALVLLTGCRGDDTSTASGAFDPARAAATAGGEPYAATVTATPADSRAVALTARCNLGAVFTGRSEATVGDGFRQENVVTADHQYTRGYDRSGKWLKIPRSTDFSVLGFDGYAKLLLALGPSARKGMEIRDGVPTYHLAGHLDVEQLASAFPVAHRELSTAGVRGIGMDQWIDARGRTRRAEQRVPFPEETTTTTYVFSDFGPVETFTEPGPLAD
ncbi:hypothetical protein [Kitasatospora purpeofusca]|uniref:hypothetical protein n=1 Tax=Kitasatospora purpeofusca TaxID=67352 RepID=UPI00386F15A7|nr:hypothetical protein OIP63_24030 [Kitasatospora purpeofusca]